MKKRRQVRMKKFESIDREEEITSSLKRNSKALVRAVYSQLAMEDGITAAHLRSMEVAVKRLVEYGDEKISKMSKAEVKSCIIQESLDHDSQLEKEEAVTPSEDEKKQQQQASEVRERERHMVQREEAPHQQGKKKTKGDGGVHF